VVAVSALLTPDATLSLDGVSETSIAEFVSGAKNLVAEKLLAAGHTVTATVRLDGRRGVGLFEFSKDAAISTVRLYL